MTRGTLDLSNRVEFAITEVITESTREVHVGSLRIVGEIAILHEGQGLEPECCVSKSGDHLRIVVVSVRSIERVDVFATPEDLTAALDEDGIELRDKADDDAPRPEVK